MSPPSFNCLLVFQTRCLRDVLQSIRPKWNLSFPLTYPFFQDSAPASFQSPRSIISTLSWTYFLSSHVPNQLPNLSVSVFTRSLHLIPFFYPLTTLVQDFIILSSRLLKEHPNWPPWLKYLPIIIDCINCCQSNFPWKESWICRSLLNHLQWLFISSRIKNNSFLWLLKSYKLGPNLLFQHWWTLLPLQYSLIQPNWPFFSLFLTRDIPTSVSQPLLSSLFLKSTNSFLLPCRNTFPLKCRLRTILYMKSFLIPQLDNCKLPNSCIFVYDYIY